MGKKKFKNNWTNHALERAMERTNWGKREFTDNAKLASKYGISPHNLPDGPLKESLLKKGDYKRIKVFKNYVFVYCKTSNRLITLYPVDMIYLEDESTIDV